MDKAAPRDMDGDTSEPRYFGPRGVAVIVALALIIAFFLGLAAFLGTLCIYSTGSCTATLQSAGDSAKLSLLLRPGAREFAEIALLILFEGGLVGIVALAAYLRAPGCAGALLGMGKAADWSCLPRALLTALAIIALLSPLDFIFPELRGLFVLPEDRWLLILMAIVVVFVAPVCEELVFRGFVFTNLRARYPFLTVNLIVTSLFALVHASGGLAYVLLVIPVGYLLGWVRERSRSLAPGIIIHAAYNAICVILALIIY